MSGLTGEQMVKAIASTPMPQKEWQTALAIAWAESSWNPDATNHNSNGSTDYGLWQINSMHGFPELSNGQWRDPNTNARLAYQVWQGSGWDAWSTHHPSDPVGYARYIGALPMAAAAIQGTSLLGATGTAADAISPLNLLKQPLAVLNFLEQGSTWVRFAKFAIGGLLVVAAGFVLIQGVAAPAAVGATAKVVGGATRVRNVGAAAKNAVS